MNHSLRHRKINSRTIPKKLRIDNKEDSFHFGDSRGTWRPVDNQFRSVSRKTAEEKKGANQGSSLPGNQI
jgi:hypothetical protein